MVREARFTAAARPQCARRHDNRADVPGQDIADDDVQILQVRPQRDLRVHREPLRARLVVTIPIETEIDRSIEAVRCRPVGELRHNRHVDDSLPAVAIRFERDRSRSRRDDHPHGARPAIHTLDPRGQFDTDRFERADERRRHRRRPGDAPRTSNRQIPVPVPDLDAGPVDRHLDRPISAIPIAVRGVIPQRVADARIIDGAADRGRDVIGVGECAAARFGRGDLEDVEIGPHAGKRGEHRPPRTVGDRADQAAHIHRVERDVRVVERPRRPLNLGAHAHGGAADLQRLEREAARDPDQVLASLDHREVIGDRLESGDRRVGALTGEKLAHVGRRTFEHGRQPGVELRVANIGRVRRRRIHQLVRRHRPIARDRAHQ